MAGKEDSMVRTIACLMFACMAMLGCREQAQEKWLARHQNVPTGEQIDRSIPMVRSTQQNPSLPRAIRESMAREPYLRDKMALVDITVRGGEVMLSGQVPDEASRDAALRVVVEVLGEERVLDELNLGER
jgi:osmotically-inducible protein OsmY